MNNEATVKRKTAYFRTPKSVCFNPIHGGAAEPFAVEDDDDDKRGMKLYRKKKDQSMRIKKNWKKNEERRKPELGKNTICS